MPSPAPPSTPAAVRRLWPVFLILLVAVLAAYHPAWFGTALWDDDAHLTRPELRTWTGLWRIWFELGATQQYYPLVHSTFWAGARIWGDHVLGFHLLNIVLHATSAYLVIVILRTLGVRGAVLAGFIFALHPVEVESVAWMTELKNTLSGTLYLASALTYLSFDRRREPTKYGLALGLFVLALLSKSVTATLPVALLIVLWWQRGSLRMRQDVLPLMPWVAIGAASGLLTAWIERTSIGASGSQFAFSLLERTLIAGRAWVFYLRSLAWPSDLVFIYPRWTIDAGDWRAYLYPLAALALLLAAWSARARTRGPLAALLFFSVTLAPALGFVNVYPFRFSFVADHFQYLAGLGVMALAAAAADALARRLRVLPASAAAIVLPLAASAVLAPLTWRQAREYTDPATLYRETLERNPGAWLAHLNLGVLEPHDPAGIARAIGQYQAALAIQPDEPQVNNNIGTSLMELGRYEEAARFHRDAVRFAPGYAEAHWNLGVDLHHLGRTDEAMTSYRTALRFKPDLPGAHFDLAVALDESGRRAEALAEVDAALRLDPAYPEAATLRRHLGDLANDTPRSTPSTTAAPGPTPSVRDQVAAGYAAIAGKRWAEAIGTFEGVLARQADAKDARRGLATALWQSGRTADAEREVRRALQVDTSDAAAHDLLGSVLLVSGRRAEAVDAYRRALLVDKGTLRPEILNDLGVALAQMGQMEQARNAFQEAVQLKPTFDAARANLERASGLGPRR